MDAMPRTSAVCIVGLGLMGGSLALALKRAGWRAPITGVSRNPGTLNTAIECGAIDSGTTELAKGVAGADVVILATPVRTLLRQIPEVGHYAATGALVMDLGSTKARVCAALNTLPEGLQPVGGHPMCGKETPGFAAADADLYRGQTWVLCPLPRTSYEAFGQARAVAEATGAHTLTLDPEAHDRAVAAISHLPYAVSVALVNAVIAGNEPLAWSLAASGFRDTSRIAASDVDMMLDILLTNRQALLEWLGHYLRQLAGLQQALAAEDEALLRGLLVQGQQIRSRMKF
jgi:prephenate dehydrogenase